MPPSLINPYAQNPNQKYRWLRGNLHAHSTRSDGSRPPQEVLDVFASLGYHFMVLSDHDVFSDYTGLDPKGMTLLLANEVTANGPHLLQVGSTRKVEPIEDRQQVIDEILATGGFAVLNHPNWESDFDHYPYELLEKLTGYTGIEIFNGVSLDLEGSAYGVEKWERLLSSGRICWGFANDDSHRPGNEGRGWNMVLVPEQDAGASGIINALRAGNFYATTGVIIDSIEVTGAAIHLKADNAQEIEIYGDKGVRLARAEGNEIRFDAAAANATYIRVQLYGHGSRMAWTQPFVIQGGIAEGRRKMEEKFGAPDSPRPQLKALHANAPLPNLGSDALEKLWSKAPASDVFYDWKMGENPPVKTAIKAVASDSELILRIECEEPNMDKLKIKTTSGSSASLWAEESLEIFLDVEARRQRNYHMTVNPAGAFYSTDPMGFSKNLKSQARGARNENGWLVELRFDLASLAPNLNLKHGSKIGFHVCRNRLVVGRHYMWSWVGSSNHTPSRYGWLEL